MPVKPILFSGPMVQALLAGRKTQTRRVINTKGGPNNIFGGAWTDDYVLAPGNAEWRAKQIPFAVGDLLWVRETHAILPPFAMGEDPTCIQKEGWPNKSPATVIRKWKPGIHMPRWASRLTLKVTDVRAERLKKISTDDAVAEGIEPNGAGLVLSDDGPPMTARAAYRELWNSLNEARGFGWDVNPWVAAYTFEVHRCNVDEFDGRAA